MIRGIRYIKKIFEYGNTCVVGLRGRGKDLLMSNVVVRRGKPYISNINYGGKHFPLDFSKLDCGRNTFKNFVNGNVNFYEFPYPLGTDVYISDSGIYLPSQYCNELNREYPYLATYVAISRHTSRASVHFNCQNLNRMYDKIREMSDVFLWCEKCLYLKGLVIQKVIYYDKYQSCVDRVKPCRIRVPIFNKQAKMQAKIYRDNFFNTHGNVKTIWLVYRNKSIYDTHHFQKLLLGGEKSEMV